MRKALGRMTVAVVVTGALLPAAPAQAATITVSTTADQFGTGPECSLREAISSANGDTAEGGCAAGSGSDTVVLPPGTHALTLVDPDDGGGDLDVSSTLTLLGAGPGQTVIEQTGSERVLELQTPGASLAVSGVTIRGGQDSSGGGIALADPDQVRHEDDHDPAEVRVRRREVRQGRERPGRVSQGSRRRVSRTTVTCR